MVVGHIRVAARRAGLQSRPSGVGDRTWRRHGSRRPALTVFRAIGELSRVDLPERPGHAARPTPTPDAQQLGTHRMEPRPAMLAPDTRDLTGQLERLGEDQVLPVLCEVKGGGPFFLTPLQEA